MDNYDHIEFMPFVCHTHYYGDLHRMKMLPERGICLDNMSKNILEFYERLQAIA